MDVGVSDAEGTREEEKEGGKKRGWEGDQASNSIHLGPCFFLWILLLSKPLSYHLHPYLFHSIPPTSPPCPGKGGQGYFLRGQRSEGGSKRGRE